MRLRATLCVTLCVTSTAASYARPLASGAWNISRGYKYHLDSGLAQEVARIAAEYGLSTIMDLGAGTGRYANEWVKRGFDVVAYDGATGVETLTSGLVRRHDLTTHLQACEPRDVVTSLEVAEHIPAHKQDVYLSNLCCAKPRLIVLSWATPGQRGNGHVNGRTAVHVRKLLLARGYAFNATATERLRAQSRLPWFKANLQAFVRQALRQPGRRLTNSSWPA